MSSSPQTVLVVGCGHMGGAMVRQWMTHSSYTLHILNPSKPKADIASKIESHSENVEGFKDIHFDIVVLAVKPQIIIDVAKTLRPVLDENTLVISIAAGVTLSSLQAALPHQQPIIRCMPNLPSSIGAGVTAFVTNEKCLSSHTQHAQDLLSVVGSVHVLDDEQDLHSVTAVSGSGPAYIFHLAECMTDAGMSLGLSHELAAQLARETIIGSARLLETNDDTSAEEYRKSVTSRGGTTQAALEVLMHDDAMRGLFERALKQASERSQELSRS